MHFIQTMIDGVWHIKPNRLEDERGYFARTYCEEAFAQHGIVFQTKQTNTSFNRLAGTLRGMHFQRAPKEEPKLVRCTAGRVYDVVVDLRKNSTTYCSWFGTELSASNGESLMIPAGCAHGFLTLVDGAEVFYQMGEQYDAALADGVRWNDPAFGIVWPSAPTIMHPRDASWPDFLTRAA